MDHAVSSQQPRAQEPTARGGSARSEPRDRAGSHLTPGTESSEEVNFTEAAARILGEIDPVLDGKSEVSRTALTVLLAQGHLLVEDVPGVGKTVLAKSLAKTIDCSVSRIQFTPDLLPSDVTGVSIYNQATGSFEFRPGAVFANIVIGDEINRASAKTQSALLECMEEHQVTVDGVSHALSEPFMVVATQNPLEMEGTYPLPEAQRDRFMARISMGYPDPAAEAQMLETHQSRSPLEQISPVVGTAEVAAMIRQVHSVFVSDAVKAYVVSLGQGTRSHSHIRLGASPRALLQLLRAAKATAALSERDFVIPDDVAQMAPTVLAHRLLVDRRAQSTGSTSEDLVREIVATTHVPEGSASASTSTRDA